MTGPYVVTVKRGEEVVSRRAVATREDLEREIRHLIDGIDDSETLFYARQVVGYDRPGEIPLPDGTVVEVERVDWLSLQGDNPWYSPGRHTPPESIAGVIVAAYNEAQEAKA